MHSRSRLNSSILSLLSLSSSTAPLPSKQLLRIFSLLSVFLLMMLSSLPITQGFRLSQIHSVVGKSIARGNSLFLFNRNRRELSSSSSSSSNWRFGRRRATANINENMEIRVRFAPSPTGSLHVGGARTALFNWLLARKTNGKFIIRVEDTDEARSTKASEESILNDLTWLNLNWDEGPIVNGPHAPYRQSERKPIYAKVAADLIAKGHAYPCFCSEEELEAKRAEVEKVGGNPKYDGTWRNADPEEVKARLARGDPHTVRFLVPEGKMVILDDVVRGRITWDADAALGDFIILRSSGMPVYNFCVAVDDADMRITHVIRAEEHLTNTLRQMLILEAMGCPAPTYAHCSLILGSDRSKLSKRHGATSVSQFKEQGFLPDAMVNYLANLGWNDGTDKEIFTPKELTQAFDLNRIVKSPAVFDMVKLRWVNAQHIRTLSSETIQKLVEVELRNSSKVLRSNETGSLMPQQTEAEAVFLPLASKIAQRDIELLSDVVPLLNGYFNYSIRETIGSDPNVTEVLGIEYDSIRLAVIRDWDTGKFPRMIGAFGEPALFQASWKAYVKQLSHELGIKGKHFFHPLRLLLTGRMSGADVGDLVALINAASLSIDGQPVMPDQFNRLVTSQVPLQLMEQRMNALRALDLATAKSLVINSSPSIRE